MKALINLKSVSEIPKRELLIFDKLIVPDLAEWINVVPDKQTGRPKSDWGLVLEHGLVEELQLDQRHSELVESLNQNNFQCENLPSWLETDLSEVLNALVYSERDLHQYFTDIVTVGIPAVRGTEKIHKTDRSDGLLKFYSRYLSKEGHDVIPIVSSTDFYNPISSRTPKLKGVLDIVIDRLPMPDADTPIEDVIRFREDPESREKLLKLRLWMRDAASTEKSFSHIADELDSLLYDYINNVKLAKYKFGVGSLSMMLTVADALLEGISTLDASKVTKAIMKLREAKIRLLEAELNAPGREVAYLQKARLEL